MTMPSRGPPEPSLECLRLCRFEVEVKRLRSSQEYAIYIFSVYKKPHFRQ
jgi:hypothetical protein